MTTNQRFIATTLLFTSTALAPTATAATNPIQESEGRTATATGRIIAAAFGPDYVVSMASDGSERARVLKFPKGADIGGIDATDDGSQIAMTLRLKGAPHEWQHIFTVNADGTDFKQVSRGGDDANPTYSPSGGRIAFVRGRYPNTRLMAMKVDGGSPRELTSVAELHVGYFQPSWSPDGKHIAFTSYTRKYQSVVLTNRRGTRFRFLRTIPVKRGLIQTLNWSPDSSKVIYARYTNHNADLWTVDLNGAHGTQITDTPKRNEFWPAYSPDGGSIACALSPSNNKDRWADVLVMDADGSNRQRIDTPRAHEDFVAWGG